MSEKDKIGEARRSKKQVEYELISADICNKFGQ